MITPFDVQMMARAVQLARRGIYRSRPNPSVGCVLVRDGAVIGEGFTQTYGGNHGEIEALNAAGNARGATAYVTLEPCSHVGKTGPCTEALIEAGIAGCFISMRDPNPQVSGSGVAKLEHAGVEVIEGLLEAEARQVNLGFFQRMETGKPRIRIKLAASMDGRTAMVSGESQWITGPEARADVQKLRARSDAIITGVDTVIADDPAMTVRDESLDINRQPLRVICDSQGRIPDAASILKQEGSALLVTSGSSPALESENVEVVHLPGANQRIDLAALVQLLAERQCNDILVECGPRLAGAFVESELADELVLYQAPVLLGSEARPLLDMVIDKMADKRLLRRVDSRQIGSDTRTVFEFSPGN